MICMIIQNIFCWIAASKSFKHTFLIYFFYFMLYEFQAKMTQAKNSQNYMLKAQTWRHQEIQVQSNQIFPLCFVLSILFDLIESIMDIDSANFDAKRYVLGMLKQNSIKELMRRNNEIDEEIKIHDHEIQSLVFENYSKFISSIDTVREMKDNICMVDDKLKVLEKSMDKISSLALKIDSTFSVKRKEIQKLDTINKDLEKLKNLCEFPSILQQDIKYYKIMTENNKVSTDIEHCFTKSILFYEQCYKTLIELKEEPLIAPIYKESIDKVQTIRSTLKAAQAQFNKNKCYSSILRSITKKLLIITDDQVSVLRIYFHSWKERFGEACFKSQKKSNLGLSVSQNGKKVINEVANSELPQINEQLWRQFQAQFKFIYQEIYPKLTLSAQEIQIYITNHAKEIFSWALNHYTEAVPLHCTSLKSFIHIHHMLSKTITSALNRMNNSATEESKIYKDLKEKMEEKFELLGVHMLNFIFGRVKMYFLLEVIESKTNCLQINISEETLKESYIKLLNPLKENITINFKIFVDDMEYFKNNYALIFKRQERYEEAIHRQIQSLLKFLAYSISRSSQNVNQQLSIMVNPLYNSKELHKNQKQLIESTVKEFKTILESGCWFIVAYHFLSSLHNNLAKKIIDNTQKNVQIPKNHNYANVFTYIKGCISKNLIAFADHFAFALRPKQKFQEMILVVQDFIDVLNIIFIQTKRNIMKKPSFLKDATNIHETEILAIKKMHILQKKIPSDRSGILLYFIRKILKELLYIVRNSKFINESVAYTNLDLYCISQLCYEMINVQEESQIIAFHFLISQNYRGEKVPQEQIEEKYTQIRKLLRDNLTK